MVRADSPRYRRRVQSGNCRISIEITSSYMLRIVYSRIKSSRRREVEVNVLFRNNVLENREQRENL